MDAIGHANGQYTPLTIVVTRVLPLKCRAREDECRKLEVETPVAQIRFAFRRMPCKSNVESIHLYIRIRNERAVAGRDLVTSQH